MARDSEIVNSVLSEIEQDPLSVDLKISLFHSALLNYRHDSILRPFPSEYINEHGEKDIETLREVANSIPRIKVFLEKRNIPLAVWKLVWWIIEPRNFGVKQVPMATRFAEITSKTENSNNIQKPGYIFELVYNNESNEKFSQLSQNMDILYGYHGSRLENFHSILHNGLHAHLNKTSLFGEGTYLSSDLNISILYSKFGNGWLLSELGQKLSCLAVCEIIDHTDVKRAVQGPLQHLRSRAENSEGGDVPEKYFVVTNNQYIRVKYILVYSNTIGLKRTLFQDSWVVRHPFASFLIFYVLCLIILGLSRTTLFKQSYNRFFKYS